jgi:hypothetical protein
MALMLTPTEGDPTTLTLTDDYQVDDALPGPGGVGDVRLRILWHLDPSA